MLKKLSVVGATALLLAVAPAAADGHEEEMSLTDVLTAHFETIGGEEAWREVTTVQMSGTMAMAQMGIEAPVQMWFKSPNKTRMEFTVQGMTGIQAFDGETAWFVMPFMGKNEPEALPAEQAEAMSEQADLNPFLDWEDKGYQLELAGKETVDGTEAYKITLTRESGNVRHYYLDTDYYLPFKVEGKTKMQGQEVDSATTLGDYKEVDGLVFAHSIEVRQGGPDAPAQVLTISDITTDSEISDDTFDMEVEKAAKAETAEG